MKNPRFLSYIRCVQPRKENTQPRQERANALRQITKKLPSKRKQIKSKSHARRLALEQIKILARGLYVIMKVVSYIKPKIRKK